MGFLWTWQNSASATSSWFFVRCDMIAFNGVLAQFLVLHLIEVTSAYFDLIRRGLIIPASLSEKGWILYSFSLLGLLICSFFLWA